MGHDEHSHEHGRPEHSHEHGHPEHSHEHGHPEHSHEHGHPEHSHEHGHPEHDRLERGEAGAKVLFLDAPSGLAGDMIIAALVDVGVPRSAILDAVTTLRLEGVALEFGSRVRSGIVATFLEVHVEGVQPQRTYGAIRAMLDDAALDPEVKARAQKTFRRLAVAEAKVHRTSLDDVHFHEVGAADALVDVVGSSAALHHLGADLIVSPLPMGRGFVKAAHGLLPLPAPATVECLSGLATYDGGLDFEFVTPTGAAIVGAHAVGWNRWPDLVPERSGWGAGRAELSDRPNLLRAVVGTSAKRSRGGRGAPTHVVVETNVDDATGELAGAWIAELLANGALDAWAVPIVMKKGRPAIKIAALAPAESADAVAHAMLRETTSLGVRRYGVHRLERPRRVEHVDTPFGSIPVKIAGGPYGPAQFKPEFDACAAAAHAHGVPVREVLRVALASAGAKLDPT